MHAGHKFSLDEAERSDSILGMYVPPSGTVNQEIMHGLVVCENVIQTELYAIRAQPQTHTNTGVNIHT